MASDLDDLLYLFLGDITRDVAQHQLFMIDMGNLQYCSLHSNQFKATINFRRELDNLGHITTTAVDNSNWPDSSGLLKIIGKDYHFHSIRLKDPSSCTRLEDIVTDATDSLFIG